VTTLVVLPDRSGAEVMNAVVAASGLAVSELGVVCTAVKVAYCAWCDHAHPLDFVCAETPAAPDVSTPGSR
jgi:hypothetical protein